MDTERTKALNKAKHDAMSGWARSSPAMARLGQAWEEATNALLSEFPVLQWQDEADDEAEAAATSIMLDYIRWWYEGN